ncbi:MAG: hypothetical protein ABI301_01680 [Jatrophihabitantaceae bacterium]
MRCRLRIALRSIDAARSVADDIPAGSFPGVKLWHRTHELVDEGVSFEQILTDPVGYSGSRRASCSPTPGSRTPGLVWRHRARGQNTRVDPAERSPPDAHSSR